MKAYEHVFRHALPRQMPIPDPRGRSLLQQLPAWRDEAVRHVVHRRHGYVAAELCKEISGAVLAYHQSDEISVLVQDWGG